MPTISDRKHLRLNTYFAVATVTSIAFGVFLQIGTFVYTSNVAVKIMGLILPLSIASVLLQQNFSRINFSISKFQVIWFSLLLASCSISFFNSPEIGRTLFGSADRNLGIMTIFIYLLYFLSGKVIASQNSENLLRWGLIVFAGLQSLTVVFQKFVKPDNLNVRGVPEAPGVWGTFYNANPLSFFLGMIATGLLANLLFQGVRSFRYRLVLISGLILMILALFWSGSSQGLIGFLVVSSVYAVKRFIQGSHRYFNSFLKIFFVLIMTTFFLLVAFLKLPNSSEASSNPYLERLEIYKSSLEIFFRKPFFGVGIDNFQSVYGQVTTTTDLKLVDNAHSLPLQILSTQGLLGFGLFLSMTLWTLSKRRNKDAATDSEWGFWQAVFFSYVFIGVIGIDHPVIGSIAYLSAGVLYGKSTSQKLEVDLRSKSGKSHAFRAFFPSLAVLLSAMTLVFSLPEIRSSIAVYELSRQRVSPEEFNSIVDSEYKKVQNARLLLVLGQAMIAINERERANLVANRMTTSFPDDQRTSVLMFAIAEKWNDENALKTALSLRNKLFPSVTEL
jgi:O-antigen ligase